MSQAHENSSIINRFDALFSLLKEVLQQLKKNTKLSTDLTLQLQSSGMWHRVVR